MVKFRTRWQ